MRARPRGCTVTHMVSAARRRSAEFLRRYGDGALAAALSALAVVDIWANDYLIGSRPSLTVTTLSMTVPLAWRRRVPLGVTAFIAGAILIQVAVEPTPHPPDVPFLAWLIASYSVAAHADLRRAFAGGALLIVAIDLWVTFTPEDGGTDLVFISVIFAGFWIAGRVVRSRNVLAATLEERTRELEHEREERARLAVAQERSRIARELHDIVAHTLGVIVVQAGAERLHLAEQSPAREALASIERSGREALEEMGRLLGMLRADGEAGMLAPQPGLSRLDALIRTYEAAGLDVDLTVEGTPRALGPGADVSAYRIVQEALTNTVRHSGSTRARVRLRWHATALEIEVADDGVGPTASQSRGGHGLLGIRERVALYGGALVTGRSELGGFLLVARLPVAAE